jgi:hypothetical protein
VLYIFACCCDLNKVYMYTVGSKRRPWVPVTSRGGEGEGGREYRQCAKCRATVAAPVKLLIVFGFYPPPTVGGWVVGGWEQRWRSGRRKREEGHHPCVPSTTSRRQ